MDDNSSDIVTEEEKREVLELVAELSDLCNRRIPHIIRAKHLTSLKKFVITVGSVGLEVGCDAETLENLRERVRNMKSEGKDPMYFG